MSDRRTTQEKLDDALDALGHIEVTCNRSRSQSRRLRWIAVRARDGIDGGTNHKRVDLPKAANSEAKEQLRRRKAEKMNEELREALEQSLTSMLDSGYSNNSVVVRAAHAALAKATGGEG